ncbi:hypothetical protein V6U77_28710 [Micromonospora sp. CPCC 205546]|uniref:hypothetical protein n=1 Tax=Micromonospora sp. CPCC 205546 TaxID=3122397 RepID=UPI002FEE84B4
MAFLVAFFAGVTFFAGAALRVAGSVLAAGVAFFAAALFVGSFFVGSSRVGSFFAVVLFAGSFCAGATFLPEFPVPRAGGPVGTLRAVGTCRPAVAAPPESAGVAGGTPCRPADPTPLSGGSAAATDTWPPAAAGVSAPLWGTSLLPSSPAWPGCSRGAGSAGRSA